MFSLFEGAQKKFGNLLDYVAAPETNPSEQANAEETRSAEEASINTAAIAGNHFVCQALIFWKFRQSSILRQDCNFRGSRQDQQT